MATTPCLAVPAGTILTARHELGGGGLLETNGLAGRLATLDLVDAAGRPLADALESAPLHLRLIDANQLSGLLESRVVSVGSQLGGDLETVTLQETAAYSGVFTRSLPTRFLPPATARPRATAS